MARQPHDHVLAKTEERVVRAPGEYRLDRQLAPPRELLSHEPAHETRVDLELVGVHPLRGTRSAHSGTPGVSSRWC
jgi:hypothetical protein